MRWVGAMQPPGGRPAHKDAQRAGRLVARQLVSRRTQAGRPREYDYNLMVPAHGYAHRFEQRVEGLVELQEVGQQHEQLVVAAPADGTPAGPTPALVSWPERRRSSGRRGRTAAACTGRGARRAALRRAGRRRRRPPASRIGRPALGHTALPAGRRPVCGNAPGGDGGRK